MYLCLLERRVGPFFLLCSLEPSNLKMRNLVYTETTSTLKVKQHSDELEFIYSLNFLALLHFKQHCPYASFTTKAVGYCKKLLNHVVVRPFSSGGGPFLNRKLLSGISLYSP